MTHWGERGHPAISHTIKGGLIRQQEVQEVAGFDARHVEVFGIPSWPVARVPRAASCGEMGQLELFSARPVQARSASRASGSHWHFKGAETLSWLRGQYKTPGKKGMVQPHPKHSRAESQLPDLSEPKSLEVVGLCSVPCANCDESRCPARLSLPFPEYLGGHNRAGMRPFPLLGHRKQPRLVTPTRCLSYTFLQP